MVVEELHDDVVACLMDCHVAEAWDTWRLFDQFRGHFTPDLATRWRVASDRVNK